jgi:hypothetical protein
MAQVRRKKTVRILLLALVSVLVLSLGAQFLEAGVCEGAFLACIDDPINSTWYGGAVYCINGYLFCKKYID